MARLVLATPEGQQVVELAAHNSLGRHPGNTIQLLDRIVSKEHCIIEQRGIHFVLRDLGSLNGTYVNGDRVVGERALRSGDEIALGATLGRYEQQDEPAPAASHQTRGAPVADPAIGSGWASNNVAPVVPEGAQTAGNFVAHAPVTFAFGSAPAIAEASPMPFATSM